jgi:hypothetical protein
VERADHGWRLGLIRVSGHILGVVGGSRARAAFEWGFPPPGIGSPSGASGRPCPWESGPRISPIGRDVTEVRGLAKMNKQIP